MTKLSKQEQKLLTSFRELPSSHKASAIAFIETLTKIVKEDTRKSA